MRNISKKMFDYLEQFHKQRIFSLDYAEKVVGSRHHAQVLINRYCNAGLLKHIRRNLYAVVNLGTKSIDVNRFQIGSQITPTAYIAYHSAFEYHGLGHQVFYDTYVASESRFSEFTFDGSTYLFASSPVGAGVVTPPMDPLVRVTDLPRTIVDCIDRIDKCGGTEELLQCLNAAPHFDGEAVIPYLAAYSKRVLYKKTGFVLSLFKEKIRHFDSLLSVCREKGNGGVDVLSSEVNNVYHKEWGLYAPQNMNSFIEQGANGSV